ncbi:MAG TPA: DUF5985 family protein [Caulobacteraceae bacterium]|nr:DUF5985 family protein [Caulobacteraceae bacterium]
MTPSLEIYSFVGGLIAMGYAVAGVFFLRFWSRTRDGLFLAFAVAFWLMALNQALVVILNIPREEQSWIYLLRLAAFVLIIFAILKKNLGGRSGG